MEIVQDLESRQRRQYVSPSALVPAYLGLRDFERTFIALDRAVDEHVYIVTADMKTSPLLDELRGDLRFLAAFGSPGSVRRAALAATRASVTRVTRTAASMTFPVFRQI